MNKKLIIIIAVVLVVAIAAGVWFFLLRDREPKIVKTEYSPGEYFVSHIEETTRLLKITVVLVLDTDDAKIQESMDGRNAAIRDEIGLVLREQTMEDLRKADQSELKEEIRQRLNTLLEFEHIIEVQFPDYAIQ